MRLAPWPVQPETTTDDAVLRDLVTASRLLGQDPYLVLHGGGNSSGKTADVLHVKASGHDMGTIGPDGFAPLRLTDVRAMFEHERMSDTEMVAALRAALIDQTVSNPSIETPLHGLLEHQSVLHTHADAIVTLTDTPRAAEVLFSLFGNEAPLLPYCMPGFSLATLVRERWPEMEAQGAIGFVLAHHGLFTVGRDARTAHARHLDLVLRAESFVTATTGVRFADDPSEVLVSPGDDDALARFVQEVAAVVGGPVVAQARRSAEIEDFIGQADLTDLVGRGPTTLEHVIHTKRIPLIGRDVAAFVADYTAYAERHRHRSHRAITMLDPMPRIVLDRELGLVSLGRTEHLAHVAGEVYRHTMRVMTAAQRLGGYVTIDEAEAFDIEYWELEQAKLRPSSEAGL